MTGLCLLRARADDAAVGDDALAADEIAGHKMPLRRNSSLIFKSMRTVLKYKKLLSLEI